NPIGVDPLIWRNDPPLRIGGIPISSLRHSWFRAVRAHPFLYLKARTYLFLRLIGATRDAPWYTVHPTDLSARFGPGPKYPAANRVLDAYPRPVRLSFIHRPVLCIVSIAIYLVLTWRRGMRHRFIGVLGGGALVYVASFFF